MKKIIISYFIIIIVILLDFGCSGGMKSSNPQWTESGEGYFDGPRGKAFYGVGTSQNIDNITLRRSTADAQSRASLSRYVKTRVSDLTKNYIRNVGSGNKTKEEQLAQTVTKIFSEMDLGGVAIVGRYYDDNAKVEYSLAMFDVENFKKLVSDMKELDKETKESIINDADAAFKELEAESTKK